MPADVATLTESHQAEQARRATLIAAIVARYWLTSVRADDPATIERWLAAVIPAILKARGQSAVLAATYGAALRKLELPAVSDDFRFEPIPDVPVEKLRTSLMVVGPQAYQSRVAAAGAAGPSELKVSTDMTPQEIQTEVARARRADETYRNARLKSAQADTVTGIQGAVARHVSDGGRETLLENAKRDPRAIGYVRVTDLEPCYFCAMLASRGVVYKSDSFDYSNRLFVGDGPAKVHDHCGCQVKAVYSKTGDIYVDRSEMYQEIWNRSGANFSGKRAILEFRREFEGRKRPA